MNNNPESLSIPIEPGKKITLNNKTDQACRYRIDCGPYGSI